MTSIANGADEEIHLPRPTVVPMFMAIGITLALVGLILIAGRSSPSAALIALRSRS